MSQSVCTHPSEFRSGTHDAQRYVHDGSVERYRQGSKSCMEKPYKYQYLKCDLSFTIPSLLRRHVQQVHDKYRPFICDFKGCRKGFQFFSQLKVHKRVHKRVHTGERPYACPYEQCRKAFTTTSNLYNHIRIHMCKLCGKCFSQLKNKNAHMRKHRN